MIPFQIIKINAIDSSNNEIKRLYHKLQKTDWCGKNQTNRGYFSTKNLTFSVLSANNFLLVIFTNLITSLSVKEVSFSWINELINGQTTFCQSIKKYPDIN